MWQTEKSDNINQTYPTIRVGPYYVDIIPICGTDKSARIYAGVPY